MTRLWSRDLPGAALGEVARTPRLLISLDFDGTCAPLVDEPMAARALPEVRTALARLGALTATTVAFVSGRSLDDLRVIAEHDDDSPIVLAASHGAQYWHPDAGASSIAEVDERERDELGQQAAALVGPLPGIGFEPKALGFGIHARGAAAQARDEAFARIDAFMAERAPGWRRRRGHDILEYAASDVGKEVAVSRLREQTGATAVVFAGDDVTDEDAMRTLCPGDLGVRVGEGESAAQLRVEGPAQMAELLHALADERGTQEE